MLPFMLPFMLLLGGCRARPAVSPPLTADPAGRAPAPMAEAPRLTLPATLPSTRWHVERRAAVVQDSAGRRQEESVDQRAVIALAWARDARGLLRGTGRVDSFVVRTSGALQPRPGPDQAAGRPSVEPMVLPMDLEVVVSDAGWLVRPQPLPPDSCDRPEHAAAELTRELLVRIPDGIATGDRWRDSTITTTCRGGVPLTVTSRIDSRLVEMGAESAPRRVVIEQQVATTLQGERRTPWLFVAVQGDGRGTRRVALDATRGVLETLDGRSTLTLRVTEGTRPDASRTRMVTQQVTLSARALP